MEKFDYLRLKPEQKREIVEISKKEGRHIYKIIERMIEKYKTIKDVEKC